MLFLLHPRKCKNNLMLRRPPLYSHASKRPGHFSPKALVLVHCPAKHVTVTYQPSSQLGLSPLPLRLHLSWSHFVPTVHSCDHFTLRWPSLLFSTARSNDAPLTPATKHNFGDLNRCIPTTEWKGCKCDYRFLLRQKLESFWLPKACSAHFHPSPTVALPKLPPRPWTCSSSYDTNIDCWGFLDFFNCKRESLRSSTANSKLAVLSK